MFKEVDTDELKSGKMEYIFRLNILKVFLGGSVNYPPPPPLACASIKVPVANQLFRIVLKTTETSRSRMELITQLKFVKNKRQSLEQIIIFKYYLFDSCTM